MKTQMDKNYPGDMDVFPNADHIFQMIVGPHPREMSNYIPSVIHSWILRISHCLQQAATRNSPTGLCIFSKFVNFFPFYSDFQ